MPKRYLTYGLIILLFVVLIIFEHMVPQPLNWNYDFRKENRMPYSCFILRDMLDAVFKEDVFDNQTSLYESAELIRQHQNIIFISENFSPDEPDMKVLLDFIRSGNQAFISCFSFSGAVSDTFKIKTETSFFENNFFRNQTDCLHFINPALKRKEGYFYDSKLQDHYFVSFDTSASAVLGKDAKGRTNFIRMKNGTGTVYFHCQPLAFTNYHLLYGNSEYAAAALSYLPDNMTIWDEYYKPGKVLTISPFKFLLTHKPLKYAYLGTLIIVLLYLIFAGKRNQRVIPLIEPPRNESLQFIETVGRLYLQKGNHKEMAMKMIMYFKESISLKYGIYYSENEEDYLSKISKKSGVKLPVIQDIFKKSSQIEKKRGADEQDLMDLYTKIERFTKESI